MEEDNLASFVDGQLCNLRDFIVNGWPNSKTDVPVSKLCHWFLHDELGYLWCTYEGILIPLPCVGKVPKTSCNSRARSYKHYNTSSSTAKQ